MKLGIIGKKDKKEVFEITRDLCKWLEDRDIEYYLDQRLAQAISSEKSAVKKDIPKLVDVVVVLGGDGTFLSVSRLLKDYETPILGVNLGGLGFLTEFTVDELFPIMEKIIKGDFETEKRGMITSKVVRENKQIGKYAVLNDLVINNGPVSRIVDLAIYIDGSHITTFKADGIIFSTPTGSTAYSLSAGGPIVYPTLPVIVITPICPHILTNRPLVVSSERDIRVKVLTDIQNTYLTLDGQIGITLYQDDEILLKSSDDFVNLIKSPFRDYFSILKTKLMWGERYGSLS